MIKEGLTLVGAGLSLTILSTMVYILAFEYKPYDTKLGSGVLIASLLFVDLFYRVRIIIGRLYSPHWGSKARKYAGFGALYLLFPLVWTFSDYGYKVDAFHDFDKCLILGTMCYNIIISFI